MDDAEAEAVLLGIGARLRWYHYKHIMANWVALGWISYGDTGYQTVAIYGNSEDTTAPSSYGVTFAFTEENRIIPRHYPTADVAKAACEHHDATGEWE